MSDKRMTAKNRAIAMGKIKEQLQLLYREDLEELQKALADVLPGARPMPDEDKLCAPGEWLEERHVAGKSGKAGRFYVYLRSIDASGKERGSLVFHGTLAQYKAQKLSN